MSIYRNKKGMVVTVVGLEKKQRQYWVIYRPACHTYDCTMLRSDFYRDFKLVQDVVGGQKP